MGGEGGGVCMHGGGGWLIVEQLLMEQNSPHTRAHAHMAERQLGERQARSRWELADPLSEVHSARINTMLFVFSLKGSSLCLFATSHTFTQNFCVNHMNRTSLDLF